MLKKNHLDHFFSADRRSWFLAQDRQRFLKAMERLVIINDGRLERR